MGKVAGRGVTDASTSGKKLLKRAWDSVLAEGFAEAVARRKCWRLNASRHCFSTLASVGAFKSG